MTKEHKNCDIRNAIIYHSERFYCSFQRSFTLPSNVKAEQIEANYSDGVLCLTIPKPEESKAQQIQIGHSKAEATKH